MRPLRITVEGFASYRSKQSLDLTDVDFFSLAGATGSGKSSLIDAMVFALYGKVPRLGMRSYAPVVNVGSDRARVALDFEVGESSYSVARMVERTKTGGAVVKEARLQQGDKALSDGADDVTKAVEELLHLEMTDFTRTVVLPQGEFAAFLEAPKRDKQALLKNILGLDIYGKVRSLAKERESVARAKHEVAQSLFDEIEVPEPEAIDEARSRLVALKELVDWVGGADSELALVLGDSEVATSSLKRLENDLENLGAVAPPTRLEEIGEMSSSAEVRVSDTVDHLAAVEQSISDTKEQIEGLPQLEVLAQWSQLYSESEEIEFVLARSGAEKLRSELEVSTGRLVEVREKTESTEAELRDLERRHSAHALVGTLVVGEPCPVCQQSVEEVPASAQPDEVAELQSRLRTESQALEAQKLDVEAARDAVIKADAGDEALIVQRTKLVDRLAEVPSLDDILAMKRKLAELAEIMEAAKAARQKAAGEVKDAKRILEDLAELRRSVQLGLMTARESVASLDPPEPVSDDVIVLWKELLAWRESKMEALRTEKLSMISEIGSLETRSAELTSVLTERLRDLNVPAERPFATTVAVAVEKAEHLVNDLTDRAARSAKLEADLKLLSDEASVAGTLAKLLQANFFEKWLLAGAIAGLVDGANERLSQLSDSAYSLRSDDEGSFSIVDHRNANQTRPVATLSGGETFLVSLALALSLAETLAGVGGADLDAIILDEGFGTLDQETLDTVASVLEDLAGTLMVGVISHVKDLADRAAVRFEVIREPGGSTVRRVS